ITTGQLVWCAATTTDFPNLLTVGAALSGNLDNSLGWWVFKTTGVVTPPPPPPPPPTNGNTAGIVASTPVATGGASEYAFSLKITSSTVSGITTGQLVWCAATTTDFPNLLTVGAALSGNLDNSLGWWVFKTTGVVTPPTLPASGSYLSVEQTINMLAANPSIVFIDTRPQAISIPDHIAGALPEAWGCGICMGIVTELPRNTIYICYNQDGVTPNSSGEYTDRYMMEWMMGNRIVYPAIGTPFTTVYCLTGGIDAWKAAGYSTGP
ncbi:MAG: rhodanese-like domain-containing protein, partial [Dehalogenimonas sp.]